MEGSHTKGRMSKLERNNILAALLATEITLKNTSEWEKKLFKLLAIILSAIHKRDFPVDAADSPEPFALCLFSSSTSKLQFFFKHEVL